MTTETCGHCGLPIIGAVRAVVQGIGLHHTGTIPPQADPIDCYRLVTVYREPIGARIAATARRLSAPTGRMNVP